MKEQRYSLVYMRDGQFYSLHIIASSEEEAIFHADSLGLAMPELVEAVIPNNDWAH